MPCYSKGRGSSRLLAGDAKQGLKAKIETRPALSGRGTEFWWIERPLLSRLPLMPCLLGSLSVFAEHIAPVLLTSLGRDLGVRDSNRELTGVAAVLGVCLWEV